MELEYKWKIPQETLAALAEHLHDLPGRLSHETLSMAASYYDTADGTVRRLGAALRLRRENDRTVCCLKRTVQKEGALAEREEYEQEAETLREGLQKLPQAGAPADLCKMLELQELRAFAMTEFIRNCYLIAAEGFTAEFAVDVGRLGNPEKMLPFEELELELKSGDPEAFRRCAEQLQAQFSLQPQPLSKLARAASVT